MKKLLVIDNLNIVPNILTDLFAQNTNFSIFRAKSFQEAKELIENNNFFVSISNVVLPDALNAEILDYLTEKNIPTVVLSSQNETSLSKVLKNKNITDYIFKDSVFELKSVYRLINLLDFIEGLEVLLVDDSKLATDKLKRILETLLLKVHVVKSGLEGLSLLEREKNISLIITDYHMDNLNGLEFTKKIRKSDYNPIVPILIMTADNSNETKVKFYKNGATDFLTKPILEEELKAKILNIFSNMKKLEEIRKFNNIVDENVITSSTNAKGVITKVSKAFCEIAGYSKEELIGKTHNIVRHPDMPKSLFKELWSTIKSGEQWRGEVKNLRRDGSYYWVKVIIEPDFDKDGEITGYTSVRQDITDRKRIYELSITDALTSLYNRRYFNEIAQEHIEDTTRTNKIFGFLILDIDNFKKYNDTYGHQKGDEVLIGVADSLKDTFKRSDDKIFRLGGEEFGILISAKTKDDVLKLAAQARNNIKFLAIEHEKNLPLKVVTASFGLVILVSNKNDLRLDDIYKLGDDKLYEAKDNGRNRIEYIEI